MNVKRGLIVRAAAGRDMNSYFVVLSSDEKSAVIADGKSRKLEKPKRKNIKHLRPTGRMLDIDGMTDKKLRRALSEFTELTHTESGGK